MRKIKNYTLLLVALLQIPWIKLYAASPLPPNAGTVLKQIQSNPEISNSSLNTIPLINIEGVGSIGDHDSTEFKVNSIVITGNTSIDTKQLFALVSDIEGKNVSLSKLSEVTSRITNHYQKNGFSFARAIVPSQLMKEGILHIEVIEALYGEIELINQTGLSDALLRSTLSELKNGKAIQQKSLDHALLSIADIPGILVSANLKAGDKTGETDLQIRVKNTNDYISGKTSLDNYGNSFLGTARVSQSIHMIDPFKRNIGETFDVNVLSTGNNLFYSKIAYEKFNLNNTEVRTGGAYSMMHYKLGGQLSESGSDGEAQVLQMWLRRSISRSYTTSLSTQIQFDHILLKDHTGLDIDNNRLIDKFTTSLTGEFSDEIWNKNSNNWNLGISIGSLTFEKKAFPLNEPSIIEGKFTKLNAGFSRTQMISLDDYFLTSLTIQCADQNLDSSEQMIIGGANSVRGSSSNAHSGDTGTLMSAEYKHNLGKVWEIDWQISAFIDNAVLQNKKNALGTSETRAQINGNGFALNFTSSTKTNMKIQVAKLKSASPEFTSQKIGSFRGWIEFNQTF